MNIRVVRLGAGVISLWAAATSAALLNACGDATSDAPLPQSDAGNDASDASTLPDATGKDSTPPPEDAPSDIDSGPGWTLTKVGAPSWTPVSVHTFAAPIGNPNCAGPATDTFGMGAPNHKWYPSVGAVGPGNPHAPPYEGEWAGYITAKGWTMTDTFAVSDFSAPIGVWATYTIVPAAGAPTGRSPDLINGPIIPNSLFPIATTGMLYRNGAVWDPNNNGSYPAQTFVEPSIDGASHVQFFFNDDMAWAPSGALPPDGSYVWHVGMRDTSGDGWDILIPYQITRTAVAADAGCTDVDSDDKNCGACGHDCLGGACVAGVCQPQAIALNRTRAYGVSIDATNAYWVDTASGDEIVKATLAGGAPSVLASGLMVGEDLASPVLLDATNAYWVDLSGGAPPTAIHKTPLGGGAGVSLAGGSYTITEWVIDATNVYYFTDAGDVMSAPLAGGATTTIATGQATSSNIGGLAVDATNLYWAIYDPTNGKIIKMPRGGGATTTLASGLVNPAAVATDGTDVYWTAQGTMSSGYADGTVAKVPVGGGSVTTLATGERFPNYLALDSKNVYFTSVDVRDHCGSLRSVATGGGSAKNLVYGQAPLSGVAVDGTQVYFTTSGTKAKSFSDGSVMKVAK